MLYSFPVVASGYFSSVIIPLAANRILRGIFHDTGTFDTLLYAHARRRRSILLPKSLPFSFGYSHLLVFNQLACMISVVSMFSIIIAQAAPAAPATQQPSSMPMMLMMGLMFAGMYFLLIRPQQKKAKEHARMLSELKAGEDIITTGGLYGSITAVKDDRFVIRLAEGVKVELHKSFIHAKVTQTK
ncbi:MAG: preprotein translocase subunit YajC [Verrucomicrobiota bacterium]|nr:preprotein translocase subunit YajC [Verrucomicrobiota bacterium]